MSILSAPFRTREVRSLESPAVPITAAALADIFSGGPTHAGISVNEFTAPTYSAVMSAVRVIAETIGSLDLCVYRRTERGRELVTDHPVAKVLGREANEGMTPAVFKENVQSHATLWGNGIARIVPSYGGDVLELLPLLPQNTSPERMGGKLTYNVSSINHGLERFSPEEVIHIPAIGYNGVRGWPPIMFAREPIALGLAAQMFGATFFGNGTNPVGVLETDTALTDIAYNRLRESWAQRHQGPGNANKPAILEQGLKWKPTSTDPEKSQLLLTRQFQISEIARVFRVPPHMLYDLTKSTNNNIEQQGMEFVNYTLAHWLVKWEQECTRKLFRKPADKDLFVEFNLWKLVRGDMTARKEYYQSAVQSGWMSVNEIRSLEGKNAVEGGDARYVPQNVALVGKDGIPIPVNAPKLALPAPATPAEPVEAAPAPAAVPAVDSKTRARRAAKASARLYAEAGQRLARKESKAAEKFPGGVGFTPAAEKFYREHRPNIIAALLPIAESQAEVMADADGLATDTANAVKATVELFVEDHIKAGMTQFRTGKPGDWEIREPAWIAEHLSQRIADTVALKMQEIKP